MKRFVLFFALGLASLTACGGDDDGGGSGGASGSGGSSSGGSGGSATGGAAGSGGSATGGAAGSGGSATGGAAGSGGSATGGTGGGTGGSGTGGTGGSSACNTLVNDGADVPETAETGTPPTMTGGTIADGTYVLTLRKDWQGSCNCTSRQKLSITGTAVQQVTRTDSNPDLHINGTGTMAGNKLTLNATCPGAQTKELTYTATATELQVFDAADQSLNVYTKK